MWYVRRGLTCVQASCICACQETQLKSQQGQECSRSAHGGRQERGRLPESHSPALVDFDRCRGDLERNATGSGAVCRIKVPPWPAGIQLDAARRPPLQSWRGDRAQIDASTTVSMLPCLPTCFTESLQSPCRFLLQAEVWHAPCCKAFLPGSPALACLEGYTGRAVLKWQRNAVGAELDKRRARTETGTATL